MADSHNTECVAAYLDSRIHSLNWFAPPNTFVWPRMSGNEVITMMVALETRLDVKYIDSEWPTVYLEAITWLCQHTPCINVVINSFIYIPHCCYIKHLMETPIALYMAQSDRFESHTHIWFYINHVMRQHTSIISNHKWPVCKVYWLYATICSRNILSTINSLRSSDATWRQWSWTTLVQAMACCLTAPSHCLNQCWHIMSKV